MGLFAKYQVGDKVAYDRGGELVVATITSRMYDTIFGGVRYVLLIDSKPKAVTSRMECDLRPFVEKEWDQEEI